MSNQRLDFIDSLRGIAIIGVIITHTSSIYKLSGLSRDFGNIGQYGVQLFFVVSAFTIFFSLSNSDGRKFQIRDFFIKRLFRIIPVYWFGIILYTIIYGVNSRGWRDAPELWHFPVHALLLNVLWPTTSSSVIPAGWSISCEVLFYLSVPLLYTYFKSQRRILLFVIATVIVWPFINQFLQKWISPLLFSNIEPGIAKQFWYRWLPNQLGCFAFGMVLFYLFKHKTKIAFLSNKKLNLILLLGLISLLPVIKFFVPYMFVHYTYAFIFMCIGLLLSFHNWSIIVNKATIFIGKISFSCYLLHFIVLERGFHYLTSYVPLTSQNTMSIFGLMLIIGFAITFPLAYLSFNLIEENATKLGRKLIKHLNAKQEGKDLSKEVMGL